MNLGYLLNNMKCNRDMTAIVSEGREYTFGDIYREYSKVKEILKDEGIGDGNVVSIIAEFSPASIAFFVALIEKNVIVVPISKAIKNVEDYIRISESEYVIDLRKVDYRIEKTENYVKHEMLKGLIGKFQLKNI